MGISDGFKHARILVKIAFFIVLVAQFCNWIAFCTTGWFVQGGVYTGLWRKCISTISSPLQGFACSYMEGLPDDKFNAIQAFAIFGFVFLNVGFLLINLFMFYGSCRANTETGVAAGCSLIFSAISWIIAVAIFGDKYQYEKPNGIDGLDYSYGLAVVALGLAMIGGVVMLIGGRGHSSNLSQ